MVWPHQYVWLGSVGFLLGVGIGSRFDLSVPLLGIATGLILLVLCLRPASVIRVVGVTLLLLLIGWWRGGSTVALAYPPDLLSDRPATMTGVVVGDPAIVGTQQKTHLLITQLDGEPVRAKVLLTSWHLPNFHYADQVSGLIRLARPTDSDEFSYSNYLAKDGIYLVANQAGDLAATPDRRFHLLGFLYRIKHGINNAIHQFLPEPHAGLLAGLLLGIKTDLSAELKTALVNSGTSHIIALSGFNVTVIISFLLFLLRPFPRRWVWLISGLMILLFVIMTGAASSVIRAAIMGWFLLLASFWGRRRNAVNAVLLAIVGMVALHPRILFYDVGFQLSVAATLGLVYLSPLFNWKIKYCPKILLEALASTLAATITTLPLIILYFGGFSWVMLGANLLVVPLVPYVMLVGFIGLISFWLWSELRWLSILVWPLSAILLGIINWFGNLPSAFVQLPPLPVWLPIGYYSMLAIIIFLLSCRHSHVQVPG